MYLSNPRFGPEQKQEEWEEALTHNQWRVYGDEDQGEQHIGEGLGGRLAGEAG